MTFKQKVNWVKIVERKHPPLFVGFIIAGLKKELIKDATDIDYEFKNFQKIGLDLYFDIDEWNNLTSKIIERTKKNGSIYLKEHAERCYSQCEIFLKISKSIGKIRDFHKMSNEELLDLFLGYTREAERMASYLTTVISCQNALEPILDEELKKLLKNHNKIELFSNYKANLSVPSKENPLVENMKELISIGSEIQASKDVNKLFSFSEEEIEKKLPKLAPPVWSMITSYVERFGWMKPHYYSGEIYMVSDVIQRLKNILLEDCNKKKNGIDNERARMENKFVETLKELDATPDFISLAKTLRDYLHLRTYRLEIFFIVNEHVRRLIAEIANRLGIKYEDIIFLTHNETIELLRRSEKANASLIKERKEGFAMIMINKELRIYSGESYKKLIEIEDREKPKIIEGTIASRGKVNGLVKIVLVNEDMNKVNKGDIIIATMTTPNFIPAIEKCSAIVTNEGGMLCHAAIVSREFGIPCITGTKIATKVFKDRDLVEVDATGTKGIIKILK